jgi:hypothetical protein
MIGKFRWAGEERKWAKDRKRSRVGRGGKKVDWVRGKKLGKREGDEAEEDRKWAREK